MDLDLELIIEVVRFEKDEYNFEVKHTRYFGGTRAKVSKEYRKAQRDPNTVSVEIVHERDLFQSQIDQIQVL